MSDELEAIAGDNLGSAVMNHGWELKIKNPNRIPKIIEEAQRLGWFVVSLIFYPHGESVSSFIRTRREPYYILRLKHPLDAGWSPNE